MRAADRSFARAEGVGPAVAPVDGDGPRPVVVWVAERRTLQREEQTEQTLWASPAITTGGWLGAVHVIVKLAVAELPAGTFTVSDVPPLTLQLAGTPLRVTVWLPAARPENVTRPLASIV